MGVNDGNAVGSEAGYDDGTDDGTVLGISVGKTEGVDDSDGVELRGGVVVNGRMRCKWFGMQTGFCCKVNADEGGGWTRANVVMGCRCGDNDVVGDECVVGVECRSPQQVAISSEISSGVHMAHVEESSAQYE